MIRCPFYGMALVISHSVMMAQHGNRCALITTAHSPCQMELDGKRADLTRCTLADETILPVSIAALASITVITPEERTTNLARWIADCKGGYE